MLLLSLTIAMIFTSIGYLWRAAPVLSENERHLWICCVILLVVVFLIPAVASQWTLFG